MNVEAIKAEYAAATEAHGKAAADLRNARDDYYSRKISIADFAALQDAAKTALVRFDAAFSAMADLPEDEEVFETDEGSQIEMF